MDNVVSAISQVKSQGCSHLIGCTKSITFDVITEPSEIAIGL